MDNRLELNRPSQDKLAEILLKEAIYLDAVEIGILKARISYLSPEELEKYSSVLVDNNPDHNPTVSPEVAEEVKAEAKPKRTRKKK
jgi:hypothetical protein